MLGTLGTVWNSSVRFVSAFDKVAVFVTVVTVVDSWHFL
jgi:hypothetical protein